MLWEFLVFWSLPPSVHRLQYTLGQPQLEGVIRQVFCSAVESATLPLSSYWTGIHITAAISNWSSEYYRILLPVRLLGPSNCDWYLLLWATIHRHTSCNTTVPKSSSSRETRELQGEERESRISQFIHGEMGHFCQKQKKGNLLHYQNIYQSPFLPTFNVLNKRLVPILFCLTNACCYSIKQHIRKKTPGYHTMRLIDWFELLIFPSLTPLRSHSSNIKSKQLEKNSWFEWQWALKRKFRCSRGSDEAPSPSKALT